MIKLYLEDFDNKCAIDEKMLRFLNFVYAHGNLHNGFYDYLSENKKEHFDRRHNINGAACVAVLPTGEEVEALFFYWKVRHTCKRGYYWVQNRGLLVAKTDKKAIEYAQKCFDEKSKYL